MTALSGRVDAIDLARGVAVALMILSHGIKGLLDFEQMPDWGLVPIHLLTKFSSSLFILVFGIALGVAFLPRVATADWPRYRAKLLLTGIKVLFWYKVLTVVELFDSVAPELIVGALLYQLFPSFVEILGFYALALLWLPFFLSLWARLPLYLRLVSPLVMVGLGLWLRWRVDFGDKIPLQALLIEHREVYTWGQLTRGPLVLVGLLIGEWLRASDGQWRPRLALVGALAAAALGCALTFLVLAWPDLAGSFAALAQNAGKHPPDATFMSFSLAGALAILALAIAGGRPLALLLRPLALIGSNALQAFIFHIAVIFVGWRFLLGYAGSTDYQHALTLTFGLIIATALWIKTLDWFQRRL